MNEPKHADLTFCFCPRCGVEMNPKHDASAPAPALLAENQRLRGLVRDAVFILAGRQRTPCEDDWLKEARALSAERSAP